jgi:hypothetical protein
MLVTQVQRIRDGLDYFRIIFMTGFFINCIETLDSAIKNLVSWSAKEFLM